MDTFFKIIGAIANGVTNTDCVLMVQMGKKYSEA